MLAKSIKAKSFSEIQIALADSLANGYKPTLALVFMSINHDINALINLLNESGIAVFGATTSAEFTEDERVFIDHYFSIPTISNHNFLSDAAIKDKGLIENTPSQPSIS